jgi:hypothetical protein
MTFQVTTEYTLLTTEESGTRIVSCDVHDRFGKVYLARMGDWYHVNVNGAVWRTWQKQEWPIVRRVKWFEDDRVLIWPVGEGAILLSRDDVRSLQCGTPSDIFVSENYTYVTYSEDAIFASSRDDPEFNIISVYSKTGEQVFGLAEVIDSMHHSGTFMEVSQACTSEDVLFFLAYQTPHIWKLDAVSKSVSYIEPQSVLGNVIAISVLGQMLCLLRVVSTGEHCIELCSLASMKAARIGEVRISELNTFNPDQIRGIPGGMFLLSKEAAVASLRVAVSK